MVMVMMWQDLRKVVHDLIQVVQDLREVMVMMVYLGEIGMHIYTLYKCCDRADRWMGWTTCNRNTDDSDMIRHDSSV